MGATLLSAEQLQIPKMDIADYDCWIRVEGAIIGDYHDINEELCYDK